MIPAKEAIRILLKIETEFPSGKKAIGSGFYSMKPNEIITCRHVVFDDNGQKAKRIKVNGSEAGIKSDFRDIDISILDWKCQKVSKFNIDNDPEIGEDVFFAGFPSGVKTASIFKGIISAVGKNLISNPSCEIFQINGMINSGNSGGPLINNNSEVIGVITAKYVPLLIEVDRLRNLLKSFPQFPSEIKSPCVPEPTRDLLFVNSSSLLQLCVVEA